jgi:hypothetical protein
MFDSTIQKQYSYQWAWRLNGHLENISYCFWVYGRICHLVSPLYPDETNKPGYGQLYIFESAQLKKKA